MNGVSLQGYLTQRYVGILLLLVVVFTLLINYLNLSGMDQTTEYYMSYEAEVLSEYYQPNDKIIEFDPGRKEYYWGLSQLPLRYQQLISQQSLADNRASLYQLKSQDVYILPYALSDTGVNFYVIHLFEQGSYAPSSQATTKQFIWLSMLILLAVVVYIVTINRHIAQQVANLHQWVKQITAQNSVEVQPPSLIFNELIETSHTLSAAIAKQAQLQADAQQRVDREKEFLSSLSHELRTPIAVVAAAALLLEKTAPLSERERAIVAKLVRANVTMAQLTETLLQLWRRQQHNQQEQSFTLASVLNEAMAECRPELIINRNDNANTAICAHRPSVQIVVNNLLRNASQYSDNNQLDIELGVNRITVTNSYNPTFIAGESTEQAQYGFGLGLYIVEQICQQQHWHCQIDSNAPSFTVAVTFGATYN